MEGGFGRVRARVKVRVEARVRVRLRDRISVFALSFGWIGFGVRFVVDSGTSVGFVGVVVVVVVVVDKMMRSLRRSYL